MASGLLSLKWNNHRSTFFHILSTIRSKESYCDVTIACDGKFYPVHKLVLSTCSDYFEQMFERTSCKHPIIVLKDIRHEELEALLNYMYVGEVNVLQNELAGLIKAAECLMIKGLAVPDEAPTKDSRESKRSSGGREDSPIAKRRKRDEEGRPPPQNQHRESRVPTPVSSSQSQRQSTSASAPTPSSAVSRTAPTTSPSPSAGSASESVSEECSQGHSEGNEQSNLPNAQESQHRGSEQTSSQPQQAVPEVILDEPGVKEEPQEVEEEVTETKDIIESQFSFDPLPEGDSRSDPGGGSGGPQGFDPQMLASQPQSMEDIVAQAIPGSSGLQGNSVSLWEGDGSLQSFPMESFTGDGSRPPQMGCGDGRLATVLTPRTGQGFEGGNVLAERKKPVWSVKICSTCGYLSQDMCDLRKHIRIHTGEKPYACSLCPYRSAQSSNLRTHFRKHHPGAIVDDTSQPRFPVTLMKGSRRQHECPLCPYIARDKTDLRKHLYTHTGEKPYACPYCSYRARQNSCIRTHVRRHHPFAMI